MSQLGHDKSRCGTKEARFKLISSALDKLKCSTMSILGLVCGNMLTLRAGVFNSVEFLVPTACENTRDLQSAAERLIKEEASLEIRNEWKPSQSCNGCK
jgi:hypothetical protein